MEYKHTQYGYTGIIVSVLLLLTAWLTLGYTFSYDQTAGTVVALLIALIVATAFWFSKLEVTIEDGEITAAFGMGRPHRVIKLSDVREVRKVRNKWIYGWGVRKLSGGWMYNTWGLDAVELELNTGKIFRIGTNDLERLHSAISPSPRR